MLCAKCGANNPVAKPFCGDCGAPLANRCGQCGAENPPDKKFCGDCGRLLGTAVGAAAATSSPQRSALNIRVAPEQPDASTAIEDERKTVTALFADIKGSTALMADLDPEEARAIIDPALRIMIDAVKRYDGYVVQSTGDGIFALFGAPLAHEDHPQRGLYAALQIQREFRDHGERRAAAGHARLEARIGVNTGEVVVRTVETGGRVEYTPIGHTLNLASRLQTFAPAGSIAVSEYTRRLVEGYFELRALGPTAVRGITEAIEVYEVTGLGTLRTHFELSARRGLTKFVGRESEIEQLQRALEQASAGHGQIVAVMAEAGTGKSRLIYEFKRLMPQGWKLLEAYSVSHGKASAWLPVLELLRKYFDIADGDDAPARREKVNAVLTALDAVLQDTMPYLFGLLGVVEGADPLAQMDPQIKRQRTLDAIKRIVLRESLNQPLVVIFEDLHWIDEQTQALLDSLVDSIAEARVLLLVNYRPEYPDRWGDNTYYSQIRLEPLAGANGAAMLASLLGESVELNPLKRLVIERTGGNPFFIEEIVQSLFDEGTLVGNGTVKVTRLLSQLRLPPTVQGILAARIDRQPGEHKQLLQTLAVIGRESSLGLLTQVAATPDTQLQRLLAELRAADFIYQQPAAGGVEYVFKHALTQEVAYNSLLIERRKQLHERAGQALEENFAAQLDDHLSQLAHHYSHSENTDKAVDYLGRAGQQALQRSASADAIGNLTSALELLPKLPEGPARDQRELLLELNLAVALAPVKGFAAPEVVRAFTRTRELCERFGDPPELFPVLLGLWGATFIRGDFPTAYELAKQLMDRARSNKDSRQLVLAHFALGNNFFNLGNLLSAREHLDAVLSLYDPERDGPSAVRHSVDAKANVLAYLAITLWDLGYPDQALTRAYESVEFARALPHLHSLASSQCILGIAQHFRREAPAAQQTAERLLAFCAEHGFTLWSAFGTYQRGWALAEQGHLEDGIAQIEKGIAGHRATGARIGHPYFLCTLAKAYLQAGRLNDAQNVLSEALALAEEQEGREHEAEIYRVKGELLLRQNDSNVAEQIIASGVRSRLRASKARNRRSCALRRVSRGCSPHRGVGSKRARCSRRSTTGSPRVSTPPT
jgi:class 3 adenylate cyclase/predicted ATPase